MSRTSSDAEPRTPSAVRSSLTHAALAVVASSLLLVLPRAADAQVSLPPRNTWELIASSGALVPTGDQRDALEDAALSTVQLSYVVRSRYAITTMLGWARSRDLASAGAPKLDVFTYDVGAEARAPRWLAGKAATFTPFAGIGAGARSYNHRSLDVDAAHNLAGYGAVGGELGMGRVHLRLEVRDYMTGFKPLVGAGNADTRNDVVAMAGLRFTRRGS
jgi:hypothetical protein